MSDSRLADEAVQHIARALNEVAENIGIDRDGRWYRFECFFRLDVDGASSFSSPRIWDAEVESTLSVTGAAARDDRDPFSAFLADDRPAYEITPGAHAMIRSQQVLDDAIAAERRSRAKVVIARLDHAMCAHRMTMDFDVAGWEALMEELRTIANEMMGPE